MTPRPDTDTSNEAGSNAPAQRNPYAERPAISPIGPEPSPYDERIKGLDGELLDAMIRGRAQEVLQLGHRDGFNEAAARYPRVFEHGLEQGTMAGAAQQREFIRLAFIDALTFIQETVERNGKRTGSKEIRQDLAAVDARVRHLLDVLDVGETAP